MPTVLAVHNGLFSALLGRWVNYKAVPDEGRWSMSAETYNIRC